MKFKLNGTKVYDVLVDFCKDQKDDRLVKVDTFTAELRYSDNKWNSVE